MTLRDWMRAQEPRKTQEEVALLLGLSQPTVSRIINGQATDEQRELVRQMTGGAVDLQPAAA